MIPRIDYIKKIKPFINVQLVKILPGVLYCGKSTILDMIKEELIDDKNINPQNIITRKYNEIIYDDMTAKEMFNDLIKEFVNNNRYYLFLDELRILWNS